MSVADLVTQRLSSEESFRAIAYRDTRGRLTIGYGFNVDAGITQFAAHALLEAQVEECQVELGRFAWFTGLDPSRQVVIIDLAFNLGLAGLLHFPLMIAALARQDWPEAQAQLLNSDAAKELPGRYGALGNALLTGTLS